jgi:citrate lyase alpha subunit
MQKKTYKTMVFPIGNALRLLIQSDTPLRENIVPMISQQPRKSPLREHLGEVISQQPRQPPLRAHSHASAALP